jgi:hypothetical protein
MKVKVSFYLHLHSYSVKSVEVAALEPVKRDALTVGSSARPVN